jgi:hypothetical protein
LSNIKTLTLAFVNTAKHINFILKASEEIVMAEKRKRGIVKRGGWEIAKKVLKALPVIGSLFTVGFAGHDIKKKGLVAGAVHVGLDATPVVGTAKNVVEIFTGDWIPDKAKGPQAVSHCSEAAPIDESKH